MAEPAQFPNDTIYSNPSTAINSLTHLSYTIILIIQSYMICDVFRVSGVYLERKHQIYSGWIIDSFGNKSSAWVIPIMLFIFISIFVSV